MKTFGQNRISVLDALRGFSLLGVILIHMQQHYSYFSFNIMGMMGQTAPSRFDIWVSWLTNNVIMGKFINIFAFLFGMSFFIQMDRAKQKGIDFRRRFCWRMILLFVIGLMSSMFYSGDILPIYAVFGLILLALYGFNNKVLIVLFGLLLIGTPRIVDTVYDKLTSGPATEQPAPMPDMADFENGGFPSMPDISQFQAPQIVEKPSFASVAKDNLTDGTRRKLRYQFGFGGRGYITLALFILGLIVGRIRFFETLDSNKKRNLILFTTFAVLTIGLGYIIPLLPDVPFWAMMDSTNMTAPMFIRVALSDIRMVLYSASIAMGFILLYQLPIIGKCLDILSPYGRMGLTNFVMQGVCGAFMFAPWGFPEIFGSMPASKLFLIGIAIYVAQVIISHIWLKFFKYGPFEWAWRSATYMKLQPFRK